MSAADVTPERFAELRLLEKHLCASGQMVGACLRESLAALESAWAERDAYLDEVQLTNENEARIMADLLATREERDRLRDELDLIKLDAEGEQNAKSELYDALFPGEPDVEREVRWKWMIMEVKKLQAELDRLRSKGGE